MIVITGGAGFIGSVLVWRLNQMGHDDLIVVDQNARGRPKWKNLEKHRFAEYLEHDEFLKRFEAGAFGDGVEGILHMGAVTDTTERDLEYLNKNNFEYTRRLATQAFKSGTRFLYASSAATYGAGELGYSDEDVLTPKLEPLNPYGESKHEFDLWVLKNGHQGRVAGFRFFNVFGPNEYHKGEMRSMIHKGYGQIKESAKVRLFKSYRPEYGDGEQERDFVYVKDTADVVAWFWEHPGAHGIFNVGSGKARTWNSLVSGIFSSLGKKPRIEYIPMPDGIRNQYQYRTQADLRKLRRVGCDVAFSLLEDAISDYVTGHLEKEDPYL